MHHDVLVIGSGQAAVPLAVRLAKAGRRVALFERAALGGTCVNCGCTPTKTMIASARAAHVARIAERLGVRVAGVEVDLAAVIRRKRAIVQHWRDGIERRLAGAGERLTLVRGHARFVGARELAVDGQRFTGDVVVIDTGARPAVPDLPGLNEVPWLDNARLMELETPPERLIILGGGYVGCEFGQMFRRFGAEVAIIDANAHLLSREDVDVSEAVEDVFRNEGIELYPGESATGVTRDGEGFALTLGSGAVVHGSHLLVAVGRRPNTDDLGCDAAGIALDERGAIVVDDRLRTTVEGVYAVGDVTGGPQFTHSSWDDHRILFDILQGRERSAAHRIVPYTVFVDPAVARVGLSERQAATQGVAVEKAELPFGHIARAIEVDEKAGLVKILLDPDSARILGAAIVGIEAGELIHVISVLMKAGASANALVDGQVVHPTLAEGLQSALLRLDRYAL